MRRFLAVLAVLLVIAVPAAVLGQGQPLTLTLASAAPDGSPWAVGLQQYKQLVESGSGGRIKVRLRLNSSLGDENDMVNQCKRGQIQGVGASTASLASVVPELNALEAPYLFRTEAEADRVLDTVVQSRFDQLFKARGLVLGFWSENGYRCFASRTDKVIRSPADLKGRKMRSQEAPVHLAMYRAMGASPVPIPVDAALQSLQTGVVDGYDNTALYAQAASWTLATKSYTLSHHIYQPAAIAFNAAFFTGLPADLQTLLLSARTTIAADLRRQIRALNPILIQNLRDMGITVYTPTAAELQAFQTAGVNGRNQWFAAASAGEKEVFNTIATALQKIRAGK